MAPLIEFDKAIKNTDGEDRALLIGNGFSAKYFAYPNLLLASGLEEKRPPRTVFDHLSTNDFEAVVRALEEAAIVEHAYGHDAHADELRKHAQTVREALVRAVNNTHPTHREKLQYGECATFLANFATVFSLNYDLLLYWANLENGKFGDGFGLGEDRGRFRGPFSEGAYCHLYNIHGGLHLFDDNEGGIMKALDRGSGVISTITDTITREKRLPVYVAEGSSPNKMKKINSIAYLRHCYEMLQRNSAPIFIYGHSADENDAHIYRAIFSSKCKHVYFGVYKPDDEKLKNFDGLLAKYQKTFGTEKPYSFFVSESARVW